MSDAKDKARETSSDDEPQGPLGGERLAKARKAQKISVLEIAKELHLDEPKVRALERNDFDVLGAPVFAKGHLKKYAQVVQVDEGDVLTDYYQLTRAAGMPPLVSARPRPRREMSPGPWIAVIVVIIVVCDGLLVVHGKAEDGRRSATRFSASGDRDGLGRGRLARTPMTIRSS